MLKIRLQRKGRKKRPIWHLVVADSRSPRDGRIIEQVGRYDNVTEKKEVLLNEDRIFYWLDSGAQPSDTVRKILRREGLLYKRHLMGWGKSEEEIEAALSEWKSYRDSKDSSEVSRKEQYQSILDAEEKEYKKQIQQKSEQAAAELEAEKAQEVADEESKESTEEATAEQGDTSATVEKEATAEDTAAKAVETETEDERVQSKDASEAKAEKPASEDVDEPVAAETETTPEGAQLTEEPDADAKEAAENVEEEVTDVSEPPATEDVKEEVAEETKAEEPATEEAEEEKPAKEEAKADSSEKVSTDLTAKEAIDHINDTDLTDLKGFVPDDEDRVTVQRAWESKQEG